MHLTKGLCTSISVQDCTNLTQAACYRTHKAIAHKTFHSTHTKKKKKSYILYKDTYIITNIASHNICHTKPLTYTEVIHIF